jgi:hypothetical protein
MFVVVLVLVRVKELVLKLQQVLVLANLLLQNQYCNLIQD